MTIQLYNTARQQLQPLVPIQPEHVSLYVCGPTVYERPHIGNARSVVVYDMLYRLLLTSYSHVDYVRNITDVDDKINAAAKTNGETIQSLTARIIHIFHDNMAALHCLPPTHEPRATEHIADMIAMIQKLLDNGCAYESAGHVYFDVKSDKNYGKLAGRILDDLVAGARIEVSGNKRNPADFVLWKPKDKDDEPSSVFRSPWGEGRPGWHIECSAMSTRYLGTDFDIHGGGADLMFPHHTNEIAQSCCAYPESQFAHIWVHNGFLTVKGEKMSKSLGNFITVSDLLEQGIKGEVIRAILLSTHYRKPLDWTDKAADDAKKGLDSFYRVLEKSGVSGKGEIDPRIMEALSHDLNTPEAFSVLHDIAHQYNKTGDEELARILLASGNMLGLLQQTAAEWFGSHDGSSEIDEMVASRVMAKKNRDFKEADRIRDSLKAQGIILEDKPDGTSNWRRI